MRPLAAYPRPLLLPLLAWATALLPSLPTLFVFEVTFSFSFPITH
jgi:hypothetical protein